MNPVSVRHFKRKKRIFQLAMIARILVLFQTISAFHILTGVSGGNHRCYVCVPNTGSSISDVFQMFPEGTVIPLCNQFRIDKPEYVRECPSPSYQGCLTQTNGTHVTKTCTEVGIEDCKTANKIRYCYCKDDLCNKESVPTEAPPPPEISADDDEDSLSEGSGSQEESYESQMETSSEGDLGTEVIHKHFPVTIKSVILTTPRPEGAGTVKASANPLAQSTNVLLLISFLSLLRLNFFM